MDGTNNMQWSAYRVGTGNEYEIRAKLKKVDDKAEVYIPRRYYIDMQNNKVKDKSERMLPGYILVGSENGISPALTKEFLKYIGPVTEEEIVHLKAQEGSKKEYLEVGSKILVIEGPFQGVKGAVTECNEEEMYRCKLSFKGMPIEVNMRGDFLSVIT